MNKKEWSIVVLPLVFSWLIDYLTKSWATTLVGQKFFGPLILTLQYNPGAMLGLFSDLPPVLRVVSLSTGGAFLVCIYGILQYLLPIKSITLRTGMSILLGGVLGNVTDRILWGHVVDFIIFRAGNYVTPVFNLSDAIQWIGYGLVVYSIIKEVEILWPENNLRRLYWVNPKFQIKYSLFLSGVGLGTGLISCVFSYTYMKVTIIELIGRNPILLSKFLSPFLVTFVLITFGASTILFMVGKILSHKIAGPIYSFEKHIKELLEEQESGEKKPRVFRLRTKDEFKHLEELALRFKEALDKKAS